MRILIVEDSPDDADLMQIALRRAGLAFSAVRVETEPDFLGALQADPPAIILCDYHLPEFSCERVLEIVAGGQLQVPVIVVSRHITAAEALGVLRLGARACLSKDRMDQLAPAISSYLEG